MTKKTIPLKATHTGKLEIGDRSIDCAVLEGGIRVLSQNGVAKAFGRGAPGGAHYEKHRKSDGIAVLPPIVSQKTLKPFISKELSESLKRVIHYVPLHGGRAYGLEATLLPKICDVWLQARDAGALHHTQTHLAGKADILMRGLAQTGIIALVDEATGYQEVRDREALQAILDKYLRKELAAWAKRFPDEFYKEMFRLKGWDWKGMSINRPSVVGKYTNNIVYDRLAPGILEELEKRNPKNEKGARKGKHHQLLTDDVGHPALAQHLYAVIAIEKTCNTWSQFIRRLNKAFPKKGTNLELQLGD